MGTLFGESGLFRTLGRKQKPGCLSDIFSVCLCQGKQQSKNNWDVMDLMVICLKILQPNNLDGRFRNYGGNIVYNALETRFYCICWIYQSCWDKPPSVWPPDINMTHWIVDDTNKSDDLMRISTMTNVGIWVQNGGFMWIYQNGSSSLIGNFMINYPVLAYPSS